MAIDQLQNNIGMRGVGPATGVGSGNLNPQPISKGGPSFEETLRGLQAGMPSPAKAAENPGLVFSKHAVERVRSRGISLGPENMQRLNTALSKAESKGSKDTLVLMDDSAFIMNVKNKTIVTAMDKSMLKENLFTNIDSTIIV